MISSYIMLGLGSIAIQAAPTSLPSNAPLTPLTVHNVTRVANTRFENLAVRANGQILSTITAPNASIYQIDPLGILPPTIIYTVPNVTSATGIIEGEPDIFYFASGDVNLNDPTDTTPSSYSISELDVRGMFVLPNGDLSQQPKVKRVASLPGAALLNGIALARPRSDHLLVADTFRGLIWNVNLSSGSVGVALNDTTTKGGAPSGPEFTGVNGVKVWNDTLYWTSTGKSALYKVAIDEQGNVRSGYTPILVASNVTCDDLLVGREGNIYVASPLDVITKVTIEGEKQIIAGTYNSTSSPLVGATALRYGRLASDRWSLYVTTNGGVGSNVTGSMGVSRIDLGQDAAGCDE